MLTLRVLYRRAEQQRRALTTYLLKTSGTHVCHDLLREKRVEDNKRIIEVTNPRVIETRSPQLTLWMLGPDEWLLFMKLPDYAVRKKQKKLDVIQLPLPDLDENQQQATFSS
jgi:sarcosine oxidase gamma subunit